MTTTFSIIDDLYQANIAPNLKAVFGTVSIGNPYTAGGESITVSSYFYDTTLGGAVLAINPSVSIQAAGVLQTARLRGDTSSTTSVNLQLFNAGLSGTANAGLFVDSTINVQSATVTLMLLGY